MPDSSPFAGLLAPAIAGPARTGELAVLEDVTDDLRTLVLHAKNGCTDSFGTLYDRYVDLVYRYIYFRVGSHPLAEDLTSETFLRALRKIGDFSWQGRDFGAWLVTIARNLVADHFKSGRYRLEVTTGEVIDVPLDGSHIPENAVVTAIINDRVLRAVRDLNPEQQECVVLRFLHGLSLAETALIMGKKSGAIKALQFRAIRALARALKPDLA
ncbi:sigma-70 family RNA polymerase sigma factor [Nonomuraea terrae]|uniref:Sigma-70 family RNA polymerase sigma factor n=1 Tax=Nonomuraea terrae TaxID=2530383 RepID=A0A4R4ZBS1_9ACTN|nr:sigma-70 family RNA polymerase sigma factor [Nonomuraea terrae]TDD55783.1 sigma-70 family RNA polymerase sigma factor [Nonomuraea terrae]